VLGGEHSPKPFVPFFAQKVGIGFWCCFGLKNTLKNMTAIRFFSFDTDRPILIP
jgi:hypothetical protein